MSIEFLTIVAVVTLLTTIANRIITSKKIQKINLDHIEEDNYTFQIAWNSGYAYGMEEGRLAEMRDRVNANMKKTQV